MKTRLNFSFIKPLIAGVFLVVSIAWLSGSFNEKMPPSMRTVDSLLADKPRLIQSERIMKTEQLAATISPMQDTIVSARILANITQVHVRAGEQVTRGQLLVSLDQSELLARVAQLKQQKRAISARLSEASKLLSRAKELHQKSLLSTQELDKSQANYDALTAEELAAQAGLNQAQTNLSFSTLISPIDGVVIERLAEPGNTAQPGTPIINIYNPSSLQVEVFVREQLAVNLQVADELSVTIPSVNLNTTAKITEIVPAANIGSRSFLVKANLANNLGLKPGMYANVLLETGYSDIIKVPKHYISSLGQLDIALVKDKDMVSRRFVRLGQEDEQGNVEIISGISAGETLVLPVKS